MLINIIKQLLFGFHKSKEKANPTEYP